MKITLTLIDLTIATEEALHVVCLTGSSYYTYSIRIYQVDKNKNYDKEMTLLRMVLVITML